MASPCHCKRKPLACKRSPNLSISTSTSLPPSDTGKKPTNDCSTTPGRPTTPIRPREDTIEEEWRIGEPIPDHIDRPSPYYKGTRGPSGVDVLTGGWHDVSIQSPAS